MTITVSTESGVLGTINFDGGSLKASTKGLQDIADTAVRRTGSAAVAYRHLAGKSNGYVHYSADGNAGAAIKSPAAAAGHFQADGYYNSASSIGVFSADGRVRMTAAQLADLVKVGPHGFTHGWRFVGVPVPGAEVSHPDLGTGIIASHTSTHVNVDFPGSGSMQFSRVADRGAIHETPRIEPVSPASMMNAIAAANHQSNAYTDSQIKALQSQISSLTAEMHAEAHRDAKVALGIRIAAIGGAVTLAMATGHEAMSVVALGAVFLDRIPEVIKEVAEYLHSRKIHTGKPIVRPPKPKPKDTKMTRRKKMKIKSASSPEEQLAGLFSSRLVAQGLDKAEADRFSEELIRAAASGGFPGDDSFMTSEQALAIAHGGGNVTMKASDLSAWLKTT